MTSIVPDVPGLRGGGQEISDHLAELMLRPSGMLVSVQQRPTAVFLLAREVLGFVVDTDAGPLARLQRDVLVRLELDLMAASGSVDLDPDEMTEVVLARLRTGSC